MYNAQNVRRIKIGIRMFLLCLTIIPTIILVFMFVQNNRLQKQMAELSQELDAAAQNIASAELTNNSTKAGKVVKKETSSDFIVEPGEFYNPYGKPILSVCSNMLVDWRMEPVQVSETPTVYLTFDDGPSSITEKVLDILDEYNVKATFFVVGSDDEYI
ncbi:MAG: polysaccharide deacetylase family protein, partial [Hydrogenoanaerobacterium sp.]